MRLYGIEPVQPFDFEEEDEVEEQEEEEEVGESSEGCGLSTILCVKPTYEMIRRYRIWKYGEEKAQKIEEKI